MLIVNLATHVPLGFGVLVAQATPASGEGVIPPVTWELVELTELGGASVAIDDPSRYTLLFLPGGELVARVDCNRGRGSYVAADGTLTVTPLGTTRMRCPPDSQDAAFRRLLHAATSYGFDTDGFLLLSGDAGVLRLRPAAEAT